MRVEGKLIPFIGAGLSAELGIPTTETLIEIIAQELSWDPEVLRIAGELSQIAEYYVTRKESIGPLRSKLDRMFSKTEAEVKKSRSHMALVDCNFPIIYTTNYDNILETAFRARRKRFHSISKLSDLAAVRKGETLIYKFHGSFEDDESLILTESSYLDRLDFESPLDIRLRSDALGKTLLFIGHSFKDINIRYLTHKLFRLRERQKQRFDEIPIAIMVTYSTNEMIRAVLKKNSVEVIELEPFDKSGSTERFLEYLRN